ncbi:MAG: MipA/OmpV family protein [Oleispira sp.]
MKWNRLYASTFPLSLVLMLFLNSPQVHSNQDTWEIKAGLAPLSASLPWKGMDDQNVLVPYLDVRKGNWSFGVENIVHYQYPVGDDITLSTGINLRDQGYKNQSSVFRGSSPDPVFIDYKIPNQEIAASASIRWWLLSIAVNQDISNNSHSTSIKSSIDLPLYRYKNSIQIKATANELWYSADYVDYYFGVKSNQENPALGRYRYNGKETVNHQFTLNAIISFGPRWEFRSIISRTTLGKGIYDSPLIGTRYENKAIFALSYLL